MHYILYGKLLRQISSIKNDTKYNLPIEYYKTPARYGNSEALYALAKEYAEDYRSRAIVCLLHVPGKKT